ncbi:MAG: hypothetical protein R2822_06655 [Spirosomataceae bacterium]
MQRFFRYDAQRIKIHVLPFVSLIEGIPNDDIAFLRQHYDVTLPYFIVSNQFYKHKNHIVVYEAMRLLKQEYPDFSDSFYRKRRGLS